MDNIVNQGTVLVVKLICELLDHSQKPVLRKKTRKTEKLCKPTTIDAAITFSFSWFCLFVLQSRRLSVGVWQEMVMLA